MCIRDSLLSAHVNFLFSLLVSILQTCFKKEIHSATWTHDLRYFSLSFLVTKEDIQVEGHKIGTCRSSVTYCNNTSIRCTVHLLNKLNI